MDSNKKKTIARLIIFYVLAFVPILTISIILRAVYNEPVWVSEDPEILLVNQATGMFGMLSPAIAHLLTRLITREGFKNSYLGWTTKKGNIRYFAASIILKPIESLVGVFLMWQILFSGKSFSEVFNTESPTTSLAWVLLNLAFSVVVFFPAFGEEWGWRGYMMPKLLEIMPKPAAIAVGGVLWGLWHAPLTVEGHNFGVDYPGYPFVGILLMCVYCIFMNAVLTFLTERTRSIYPASFCHMINNNLSIGVMAMILMNENALLEITEKTSRLTISLLLMGLSTIAGAVCFILFVRKGRSKKAAEEIG